MPKMTLSELISVENIAESIKETLMAEGCMYRKKKNVVKESDDDDTDKAMGFERGFRHFKHAEQEHELRHDWKPKKKTGSDNSGPHAVHINGKKWKSFPSHSHAMNVGNKIASKSTKNKVSVHKEEVEQIDELSNKTLKSYVNKAKISASKLNKTMNKAYDNADSAEAKGDTASAKTHDTIGNRAGFKYLGREGGIAKAKTKLAKEEVEQVNELSKPTLTSYVKKSSASKADNAMKPSDTKTGTLDWKAFRTFRKRHKGIKTATSKLAKESKEEKELIDERFKKGMPKLKSIIKNLDAAVAKNKAASDAAAAKRASEKKGE